MASASSAARGQWTSHGRALLHASASRRVGGRRKEFRGRGHVTPSAVLSSWDESSLLDSEDEFPLPGRGLFPDVPRIADVVGLGQAMVDFSCQVNDNFLEEHNLDKGGRRIIDVQERGEVLDVLDGEQYKLTAGGSLSNTLVTMARLGLAAEEVKGDWGKAMTTALVGSVGTDPMGDFYRRKVADAGMAFLSEPVEGTTGTVVVLTTPDAERSFLSYLGTSATLAYDDMLAEASCSARVLLIEGYLFELEGTLDAIHAAVRQARKNGVAVAVSASNEFVVRNHKAAFDAILPHCDILFANAGEARALLGDEMEEGEEELGTADVAAVLGTRTRLVAVTDGSEGSRIVCDGVAVHIPACAGAGNAEPVDFCGAGDAYAGGFLHGYLNGWSLRASGNLAARTAATVISRVGPRLKVRDAKKLFEDLS